MRRRSATESETSPLGSPTNTHEPKPQTHKPTFTNGIITACLPVWLSLTALQSDQRPRRRHGPPGTRWPTR